MNPNLKREEAFLRKDNKMFSPVKEDGSRELIKEFSSINQAKLKSRELMKAGHTIVKKG